MKENLLENSFDFSIRLMELNKYLMDEGKAFPLSERLLACGSGICVNLSMADIRGEKDGRDVYNALADAVESGHLLKLMAKTGYLTEQQSIPLRNECDRIIELIVNYN